MTKLEEKIQRGYKRLSIILTIWTIIPLLFIFFIKESYLIYFIVFEMIWIIIGIFYSFKLLLYFDMKKIWK